MRHQMRQRDLRLARIGIGERPAAGQQLVDARCRARSSTPCRIAAPSMTDEKVLPGRAHVVGVSRSWPKKYSSSTSLPAARHEHRVDERGLARGRIAVDDALHGAGERRLVDADLARRAPCASRRRFQPGRRYT